MNYFYDATKENMKPESKLTTNSWSSILNINNWRLGSGHGKTNSLFNLISRQPGIDIAFLYAKDPYEAKYWETTGLKNFHDSKGFIECSNDMDDIYKNIGEYNPNKKHKVLIIFDARNTDMRRNKKKLIQ